MDESLSAPGPTEGHPDPAVRVKSGADGVPAVLADGKTWLLGDGGLLNVLDPVRDRLFDDIHLRDSIGNADVGWAAWKLLEMNYELTRVEGRKLIFGANLEALADAVIAALFGPPVPVRTYTTWAASSLLANGIDPTSVPTALVRQVLDLLVATKRTIPAAEFCESVAKAEGLDALRALASKTPGLSSPPPG